MRKTIDSTFVPIRRAAAELGVPLAWLKCEAEHRKIPAVRAGRRWLVHIERAQMALAERAGVGGEHVAEGGAK